MMLLARHHGFPQTRLARATMPILLILGLYGCATRLPEDIALQHSPQQLVLASEQFVVAEDLSIPSPEEVLALDDEMRAFLADIVEGSVTDKAIMVNLLDRLLISGPYVLRYDNLKTYTARETFHAGEGNCLSFTNLFVALARSAGLKVYFQEIKVPHNWEQQGETWMYNRHINARVDLEEHGEFVVDFNFTPMRDEFHQRRISDEAALSQFYNNMGVHWMMAERYDLSYLNLREAISMSSRRAYFWTNLGVLYSRVGDDSRAESAWLHALSVKNEPSAASNLARYYKRVGNEKHAAYFQEEVRRFRHRNPYYLYKTAESAYHAGDYRESISSLEQAVRIRDNEEQFYRLLGLNYIEIGDVDQAREAMEKASQYAVSDTSRRSYNRKLELLEGTE
ncbi:MAG: transglutaminase domain-containing protein [Pseudomonadota bacterium]